MKFSDSSKVVQISISILNLKCIFKNTKYNAALRKMFLNTFVGVILIEILQHIKKCNLPRQHVKTNKYSITSKYVRSKLLLPCRPIFLPQPFINRFLVSNSNQAYFFHIIRRKKIRLQSRNTRRFKLEFLFKIQMSYQRNLCLVSCDILVTFTNKNLGFFIIFLI